MADPSKILSSDSLILIFTYAPAGFGHLRVTDALYHGLPKDVTPVLLESQDKSLTFLHRIASIHPIARAIFERIQRGKAESIVTFLYKKLLRSQTKLIYQQLSTILDQRIVTPETVVVVATHFGLAHQLAAVKEQLQKEKRVKVILFVQVTDDSPQKIWYVNGADIIFVPSEYTKGELEKYGREARLDPVQFQVLPYPVSPNLSKPLTPTHKQKKLAQLDPKSDESITISIPISGAAVGLEYFLTLIDELYLLSHRFRFLVIVKSNLRTQSFINEMLKRPFVSLFTSSVDKGVVEKYEDVYKTEIISLEITKPSEQAFKALISPDKVGGAILLLSHPVGRQEHDNLSFLFHHCLLPSDQESVRLFKHALQNPDSMLDEKSSLLEEAKMWRGIKLLENPKESAKFIYWCLKNKIFASMGKCKVEQCNRSKNPIEIEGEKSVDLFWEKVSNVVAS